MAEVPLMAGKFVLVTGGTGGIGKATALGLAALGAGSGASSTRMVVTERSDADPVPIAARYGLGVGDPSVGRSGGDPAHDGSDQADAAHEGLVPGLGAAAGRRAPGRLCTGTVVIPG